MVSNIDHLFRRTVFRLSFNLDERRLGIEERDASSRVRLSRMGFMVDLEEDLLSERGLGG
jgi:hypothetical protein